VKDVLDRVGAAFLIVATSPLWVAAAIGIKLSSPGPIFFAQSRAGRSGRSFRMFKFRTMCTDAEAQQMKLEKNNQMSGPVFKLKHDPRIFAFGRWLRRLSIDELPQLINVLRGEMSLVGPRPLPTYEIQKIEKHAQRRRLSVKPGLTCLWQVMGRNTINSFEDWVALHRQLVPVAGCPHSRPHHPSRAERGRGALRAPPAGNSLASVNRPSLLAHSQPHRTLRLSTSL
jgi:lipopolysaccharide/colanic/teichoic acid biosynthesis glycosyltransferase